MKRWNAPLAAVQQFIANDYVAACTNYINCNVDMQGYAKYKVDFNGKTYTTAWSGETWTSGELGRCGKKMEIDQGEYFEVKITQAWTDRAYKNLVDLPEEQQFTCIIWHELDENGLLVDGHGTKDMSGLEFNKS